MKNISDEKAVNIIVIFVLLLLLISWIFQTFILEYIAYPLTATVPGIDVFSSGTDHYLEIKSFWGLSWAAAPLIATFVGMLAVKGTGQITKSLYTFVFVFIVFIILSLFMFFGIDGDTTGENGLWAWLYGHNRFGAYLLSACIWISWYSSLLFTIRVCLSFFRTKHF